ncbi:unnamed protein product [Plutella xylostella]|uniref:Glycoprotein-N-acetylgalactosamine 3-beta-galactosyltransferase 1 n=1 Tax=Plutella xylostella TaxID=51655 RepID=A0A8S4DNJ7_PLUXY|nr:unnamed protein product [Plutella xylostella]
MLSHYNTTKLLYFGHRYNKYVKQGYMAGGPGYVISRGALEKFGSEQESKCKRCNYSQEDCEMGICLAALGVKAMDSRDFYQRERFMVMGPSEHMFPSSKHWCPPVIPITLGHFYLEAAHVNTRTTVSDYLSRRVRVLCWVMTHPRGHQRALHAMNTWGKRCNKVLLMSTEKDSRVPTIPLEVQEGKDHLYWKSLAAFAYIYDNHRRDADWFLKADDDTFVIVENVRFMLSIYNHSEPLYFGHRFQHFTSQGYMSGGAGYVLSGAALDRLIQHGYYGNRCTSIDFHGAEDVSIGVCLDDLQVKAMDSRDVYLRERFFPFIPSLHMFPSSREGVPSWYPLYTLYPQNDGINCCSDFAISFHYILPEEMHLFDYLLYHLRPYGVDYKHSIRQRRGRQKEFLTFFDSSKQTTFDT